jgi:ABC-type Zn uptake system ZnuABC Zn-binding protein ZnuA
MVAGVTVAGQPAAPSTVSVVTSNTVLADLVRNVGGDLVRVRSLAPAGTDPHTFQPTPDSMKTLSQARLVFFNGAGLEEWWGKSVRSVGRGVPVIELSKGLATLDLSDASSEIQQHRGTPDPHVWLDPVLTKTYVERIRDALSLADPPNAARYADQAGNYLRRLDELDAWIRSAVDQVPAPRRKLVTFHDAFQYFAKRYGLTVRGFVVVSPGKEPSAKAMAELTRRIKAEQIPAVFAEADFNAKLLQALAKDAGVKVMTNLYDGSLTDGPPAGSYLNLMRHDVTTIVNALK